MNVLVLNGSPAGKNSITLQTVEYLKGCFPSCEFRVLHVGQKIRSIEKQFDESAAALAEAQLILFCYPVYTFLVPAQLHRFIELMKEHKAEVAGKYATQLTTSKHFYDTTAHRFIEENCADLGLKYIRGLSADMEDLLNEKGRREAVDFFRFVRFSVENGCYETPLSFPESAQAKPFPLPEAADKKKDGEIVVVTDGDGPDGRLKAMAECFDRLSDRKVRVVDVSQFRFSGGCLGCFKCAGDGTCVYKDGFDRYLRGNIQSADAIVYAYTVKDHSMGSTFKTFDDRQFCNGHRTVTMGKPVGYLVCGDLTGETNLNQLMEARAEVGGNFLAGVASDCRAPEEEIARLAKRLSWALDTGYQPPANFYGVGGMKIFRDLIYQMQGLMHADHQFYKEHGFYDFPQRHKAKIAAMYLVGGMMRSKKLEKQVAPKMTEGMLMPYKKVLKDNSPAEK
ncbi:MAG: NAD(P)H-dependent oxidoreductase [Clostridia bacterium]|nr:NAD(P)H-dependent oxidoreductase [Clostridia bacterium]